MAIPSRQIGWGTESNLLWQILKQLTRLTSTLFSLKEAATPKYKVYTALLTQTGTNAPVATILENTIGNIVWSRVNNGRYRATLNGSFTTSKTYITSYLNRTGGPALLTQTEYIDLDKFALYSYDNTQNNVDANGIMGIEIKVYN